MSWRPQKLDQLGTLSRGRSRHRPRDAAHLYGGPYPFIQTSDVKHSGLYIREYQQTYSEEGLRQSKIWPAGTLCITIAANIADTAILGIDACFPDSVIGFTADENKSDVRFIKYLFDATIQQRVRQFTQGAAQDNLSQEKLLSIEFLIPELQEQRRIASILSAYDDLIANNRRRIQLLEEAARLLYREWFVHLRFPGHEHAKIKDGIPEGWKRGPLGQLCVEVREICQPASLEPDAPYIGLEHMPRRSIALSEWGTTEQVTSSKHRFRENDILFGKIRPYFHKVGIALTEGIASSDAIVIRPASQELLPLVLMVTSSDAFVADTAQKMKEGSKMPRADWKQMTQYPVLYPSDNTLWALNDFIEPILQQIKTLVFSNRNLAVARDLLLPKLMSGEVAV
ncbi:MAG TPA: restriction endonuclease subunit S [Kiritimatiellia bacterium]|jgi:type I restriction enzyme S subunit|nr:restriction endonuclease subunit S [Kiritimatiellia bacterium]OQC60144.1 MAG: Type I restriction modification DNA specificity domain protein [Verrucomicrobia bacterium ADurb.Bin018]HOD99534.1 restriction endonuclease subunit S [Kiritimatiellia bacterium]HPV46331.1 restriction endonuclease subunit S [Kiritimatiellia bacterium]HQM22848.1 restriction endonuclease subunit S [Kiritimatiellia bacterium]